MTLLLRELSEGGCSALLQVGSQIIILRAVSYSLQLSRKLG